jgi:hypothetical protein
MKPFGHICCPILDGLLRRDRIKRGIALDGRDAFGILAQKLSWLCAFGIEIPHPPLERPDRTAQIKHVDIIMVHVDQI